MATEVKMPKWGMTMKKGKITKWIKNEGDQVEKGDELFEVETEKITNTVESITSGTLFQILVPVGESVPVKSVVALIADEGEQLERVEAGGAGSTAVCGGESAPAKPAGPIKASPAAKRVAKDLGVDLTLVKGSGPGGRITEKDIQEYQKTLSRLPKITPLAKSMADKGGIDISELSGTGDGGKITREDIEKALAGASDAPVAQAPEAVSPAETAMAYSGMRKAIGDNMLASLQNAAQLTCFTEVDVTEMVRFLEQVREEHKKDATIKISYNDIIVLAVSRALKHHPIMNSTRDEEEITFHHDTNMGIAVAVKEGLIVPVLQKANQKGLIEIAAEARRLAKKARENTLDMDDISGGTFTISNTSMIEVDGFTPILRPPETGILGVGRVKRKPAEHKGEIALRWMMVLSLTYDHCVVDGAPAHAFLAHVGRYLQNPYLIMS
ncbi:pyruvate dehydrogenase E2 component (dihydrolipoamide acetyltransferase) [Desulfocicer vacuolatum DSM 3385]|uniref:Dihydrolipoamide acetyltransferase component of pyruvate dehydrogenase complex n=1 Tax=Desulfocicer vacuolatum DSM 3385 TaxID=1121400 RepID=A0A1W2D5P2_9BACT|nr:dihydrolipoamide acetyltransferase family protein [Desulfocicer vacuolatum]SMC92785.1 pyruvate dehydrogenase E2 component (dihydrolipoamide acetyltransferase) [Desulfocicer vacuolatum DSM 3385]